MILGNNIESSGTKCYRANANVWAKGCKGLWRGQKSVTGCKRVTIRQVNKTVGKSPPHPLTTPEMAIWSAKLRTAFSLRRTIWTAKIWSAFSRHCGGRSGVHALAGLCPWVLISIANKKLRFATVVAGGSSKRNPAKMMGQGAGIVPWKFQSISLTVSPWKSQICVPPNPVGFILSTLAPKWAAPTLNLCSQYSAQVSCLCVLHKISAKKYSTWRLVLPAANLYAKDCT